MRCFVTLVILMVTNLSHALPRCVDIVSDESERNYFIDCDIYKEDMDYSHYDAHSRAILLKLKGEIVPAVWHRFYNGTQDKIHIMVYGENGNSIRIIHCCEHIPVAQIMGCETTYWRYIYRILVKNINRIKKIVM